MRVISSIRTAQNLISSHLQFDENRCVYDGDVYTAREIEDKSVCIDGDIREILMKLSAL